MLPLGRAGDVKLELLTHMICYVLNRSTMRYALISLSFFLSEDGEMVSITGEVIMVKRLLHASDLSTAMGYSVLSCLYF